MKVTEVTASLEPSCLLMVHSYYVQSPVNNMCVCACISTGEVSILIVVLD
jgi:hypothetical protein